MSIFEVEVTVVCSIPVEAETQDAALDIAVGDALDRHLANGNFDIEVTNVESERTA